MHDDLISFPLSRARDMNRPALRRTLHAHIACEEAHAAREWLLWALLVVGVPIWAAALAPARVPARLRSTAADLWAAGCVALAVVAIAEWLCRRLRDRYLEEMHSRSTQGEPWDIHR